jgi:hypothetical protein
MSATPSTVPSCPLCDQALKRANPASMQPDVTMRFTCDRCGEFKVLIDKAIITKEQKHLLSAACRMWTGTEIPTLGPETIPTLVQQVPKWSVSEKLDRLLELAAKETEGIGSLSTFDIKTAYPLIVARNVEEVEQLARALLGRGLVTREDNRLFVTIRGWERVEEIRRSGPRSSLVFVAMWFDPATTELYEKAIGPAIREAGYEPLRIDQHEHVNRIDDEIIGQMRRSKFMVADFTGQRPGVYFEAGFMMGLGRNVIWMCDKKALKDLHFDVRQYSFIDWESVHDARTRLKRRILSLEGEGPRLPTVA